MQDLEYQQFVRRLVGDVVHFQKVGQNSKLLPILIISLDIFPGDSNHGGEQCPNGAQDIELSQGQDP